MAHERDMERRVRELEDEVARLKRGRLRGGVRRRSTFEFAGVPLWEIAIGPNAEAGEWRGHAKAVLALGDFATGVVAIGGIARGILALGGLSMGLVTFGGMAMGLAFAMGGLVLGGTAVGGGAVGGIAIGGGAWGRYACGGLAGGTHVISAARRDPEAERFFRESGLLPFCHRH